MQTLSATYSPEDNKLRLYTLRRLDDDTYARLHAAGFRFAPKQDLFVAPAWTPEREELLMELCGEIGDEDTSLVDRAEQRADRFQDYSESRERDYAAARNAVAAITEHIPMGQPILVGHHSEKRARKDAERIEKGLERAVRMWDTAEYWKRRAAGALRAAKYKERPDVRHRRIKSLEADKRKQERIIAEAETFLKLWQGAEVSFDRAVKIAAYCPVSGCFPLDKYPRNPPASQYEGPMSLYCALNDGVINEVQAREIAVRALTARVERPRRWIAHYDNRIAYERAMLDEQGGVAGAAFDIQPGGHVLIDGDWLRVERVTKRNGQILSVTTSARFVPVRGVEKIQDYRAPDPETAKQAKAKAKLPPLCNYPADGFRSMTKAEWDATHRDYKGSRELGQGAQGAGYCVDIKRPDQGNQYGRHRVRCVVYGGAMCGVYLTDVKRTDPPAAAPSEATTKPGESPVTAPDAHTVEVPEPVAATSGTEAAGTSAAVLAAPGTARQEVQQMRELLRVGVQAVSAPQLFPTPASLAARMVRLAELKEGARVLEPSAGTGAILRAVREYADQTLFGMKFARTAVEISAKLCAGLRIAEAGVQVLNCDFLECDAATLGQFDAVIMNPPFANAQDIAHIKHALQFLKPGARLVAICANGPRQNEQLRPLVQQYGGSWEVLPDDTFKQAGTTVRTVLLSLSM